MLFISNFYIISCSLLFVKNFFQLFLKSFCSFELLSSISAAAPCDVDYHITPSTECQHLFLKFFIFFKLFIQFQVRSHILRKHVSTRKKAVRNPHHFPAQFSAQLFFIYYDDTRVKRSCVSCLHEKALLLDPQNTEK